MVLGGTAPRTSGQRAHHALAAFLFPPLIPDLHAVRKHLLAPAHRRKSLKLFSADEFGLHVRVLRQRTRPEA